MSGWRLAAVVIVAAVVGAALSVAGVDVVDRILCQAAAAIVVLVSMDVGAARARRRAEYKQYVERAAYGHLLTERVTGSDRDYLLIHAGPVDSAPKDFHELPAEMMDRLTHHVPGATVIEAIDVLLARDELSHLPERESP